MGNRERREALCFVCGFVEPSRRVFQANSHCIARDGPRAAAFQAARQVSNNIRKRCLTPWVAFFAPYPAQWLVKRGMKSLCLYYFCQVNASCCFTLFERRSWLKSKTQLSHLHQTSSRRFEDLIPWCRMAQYSYYFWMAWKKKTELCGMSDMTQACSLLLLKHFSRLLQDPFLAAKEKLTLSV